MKPDQKPHSLPPASVLGLWLFALYLAIYAGFVWIAAFAGSWLGFRPLGGVNLAILYGFGLIILPLILALIYLRWTTADKEG